MNPPAFALSSLELVITSDESETKVPSSVSEILNIILVCRSSHG